MTLRKYRYLAQLKKKFKFDTTYTHVRQFDNFNPSMMDTYTEKPRAFPHTQQQQTCQMQCNVKFVIEPPVIPHV